MIKKNYYIDRDEFETLVMNFKARLKKYHESLGKDASELTYTEKYGLHLVDNKLSKCIIDLSRNNLKSRKHCRLSYDEKEEMNSHVLMDVLKVLNSYNPDYYKDKDDKKPNAYGFFTRCVQTAITKQYCEENKRKAKRTEFILFLDDMEVDFGNDEDNSNFKTSALETRGYVNSLDNEDLMYYVKAKTKLPKQLMNEENIESLRSIVLGINQYHKNADDDF
jgi:hypothetical protein